MGHSGKLPQFYQTLGLSIGSWPDGIDPNLIVFGLSVILMIRLLSKIHFDNGSRGRIYSGSTVMPSSRVMPGGSLAPPGDLDHGDVLFGDVLVSIGREAVQLEVGGAQPRIVGLLHP